MNKPIPGMNRKKCCMFCGCHLAPYAESDICEVCFDERYLDDILMDLDTLEDLENELF